MYATARSFAPLCAPSARLLILGSMPGRRSLAELRYYAHPRNAFWPIMGRALGFDPGLAYDERCAALLARDVAVWDVLARCERRGSLDADIVDSTVVANDIGALLGAHPGIRCLLFNGAKAEQSFRRHVLPGLPDPAQTLERCRLPSTSPAHASLSFDAKLAQWRRALATGLSDSGCRPD